jgi:ABC-type sugar transport system substrate-binding protein
MFRKFLPLAAIAVTLAAPSAMPASALAAERQSEQNAARNNVRSGGAMRIRYIEARVLPRMRGMTYIGFTYYPVENVYRLRFMRGAQAVDVEVDARTGDIIGEQR